MIYFDSAATTLQKPASVPAAVADAIRTMTTPGRGDHPAARRAGARQVRGRGGAADRFLRSVINNSDPHTTKY